MRTGRLSLAMSTIKFARRPARSESPSARADRLALWILLALGLLLMLVSVGKAEQPSAVRVDRFQGPMRPGQTIHVENVSGDVVASPGKEFSAVVTVTVSAASQKKAEEILARTRIAGDHDADGWSLETRWPGAGSRGRSGRHGSACEGCRIVARYEIVVPSGVAAELQTVNGDVRVRDCDGDMHLETVNGSIDARGARHSLEARTVNGKIEALSRALPFGASVELQSVNGKVVLTLPKDARFDLTASTMNGTIASTFPLPVRAPEPLEPEGGHRDAKGPKPPPKAEKGERPQRMVVHDEDGETTVVDLRELEREISESMKDVQISIEEGLREAEKGIRQAERQMHRIRIVSPRHEYSGSLGKGGAEIRMETLNGAVLLLAEGTSEADARPLVSERRSFAVTIPSARAHGGAAAPVAPPPTVAPPAPVAPPAAVPAVPAVAPAPPAPVAPPVFDGEVVRGDVSGDFLSTSTGGNYTVGKVSGRVRILTHSGEIRLGGAGAGADLKTFGGDIVVGPVTGDLKASTMAGDIRAGSVSGSALADTAGGDIRIERVGGNLDANTAGGDIVAPRVAGGVRAATAGGDVRIGVTSRDARGGVAIHNSGGDVTLSLPPDVRAEVELAVTGADEDDSAIRSDFPELSISKKAGTIRGTASLNGGGEKIVIRTTSGTIRLKKAAAEK